MVYRLTIDINYIGEPPPIEITITNLNDNIDNTFLNEMMQKCGILDEITIYRHPVTNKHLGLARLVFNTVRGARNAVDKYHKKSVMGKVSIW